ncbi:MAG: hypothetical protein HQK51_11725 [Oligoflexia bacterium]|nr:hypothetical protein [Oligoflexia bacterium]
MKNQSKRILFSLAIFASFLFVSNANAMYLGRWHFTFKDGMEQNGLTILKKWGVDVGARIGWKNIRLLKGSVGPASSKVEFEIKFDKLEDYESALLDAQKNPYHTQYMQQINNIIIPGSISWNIYKIEQQ